MENYWTFLGSDCPWIEVETTLAGTGKNTNTNRYLIFLLGQISRDHQLKQCYHMNIQIGYFLHFRGLNSFSKIGESFLLTEARTVGAGEGIGLGGVFTNMH